MRQAWIKARRAPLLPIVLLLPVLICGIFGSVLAPHDPTFINTQIALRPPSLLVDGSFKHVFGTDYLGRDIASRIVAGARATLSVSITGVVLAGLLGVSVGVIAAYWGGWIDQVLMRIVDIQLSVPAILLALLITGSLGAGLTTVIVVIALVFWTQYARVARGETLSIKEREFVILSKVTGSSTIRILIKHILPNLIDSAVVVATLQLGMAVMIEAALSFLGLGVQPPDIAWGKMIAESRLYMSKAWWLTTFPGLAVMMTVLGANLLGDWLRDKLDPKLRQI